MFGKMFELDNLCEASPLASIVFCCKKDCEIRNEALKLLGITVEKYHEVKEKHRIDAPRTCFGNLAYCCSPNKKCDVRDSVLKEIGMDTKTYLKYKYKILRDLIPSDKIAFAFKERVLHKTAFEIVYLDDPDTAYRGIAIANPDVLDTIFIISCNRVNSNISSEVKSVLKKEKILSVRLDKDVYEKLQEHAEILGCSVSDVVRQAITSYIMLARKNI